MPDRPHLFIKHEGRVVTYKELAGLLGLPLTTLYSRHRVGLRVDLPRDMRRRVLRLNGRQQTLGEWAEELGITRATLRKRLKQKFPPEKLFIYGNIGTERRGRMLTHDGRTLNMAGWARELGITRERMRQRVVKWRAGLIEEVEVFARRRSQVPRGALESQETE